MARQEQNREDILAEATALVERAEFTTADEADPIIVGFRTGGAASIYFGQEIAYHFDSQRRLRRAYLAGRLYKADRGRLASLERRRTGEEVQLLRHDLSDAQSAAFLDEMQRRTERLKAASLTASIRWLRQVPDDDVSGKIASWLAELPARIEIAQTARVR